jgi:hypothetical protein
MPKLCQGLAHVTHEGDLSSIQRDFVTVVAFGLDCKVIAQSKYHSVGCSGGGSSREVFGVGRSDAAEAGHYCDFGSVLQKRVLQRPKFVVAGLARVVPKRL